jgi:hypothetical protein
MTMISSRFHLEMLQQKDLKLDGKINLAGFEWNFRSKENK